MAVRVADQHAAVVEYWQRACIELHSGSAWSYSTSE
jgi:hypothetical protein